MLVNRCPHLQITAPLLGPSPWPLSCPLHDLHRDRLLQLGHHQQRHLRRAGLRFRLRQPAQRERAAVANSLKASLLLMPTMQKPPVARRHPVERNARRRLRPSTADVRLSRAR